MIAARRRARRSSTSSAGACSRSPSRNFCRRGNFSTVGTNHSTKRYIDSTAGPIRRAPCPLSSGDATAIAGGEAPQTPQEVKKRRFKT